MQIYYVCDLIFMSRKSLLAIPRDANDCLKALFLAGRPQEGLGTGRGCG